MGERISLRFLTAMKTTCLLTQERWTASSDFFCDARLQAKGEAGISAARFDQQRASLPRKCFQGLHSCVIRMMWVEILVAAYNAVTDEKVKRATLPTRRVRIDGVDITGSCIGISVEASISKAVRIRPASSAFRIDVQGPRVRWS